MLFIPVWNCWWCCAFVLRGFHGLETNSSGLFIISRKIKVLKTRSSLLFIHQPQWIKTRGRTDMVESTIRSSIGRQLMWHHHHPSLALPINYRNTTTHHTRVNKAPDRSWNISSEYRIMFWICFKNFNLRWFSWTQRTLDHYKWEQKYQIQNKQNETNQNIFCFNNKCIGKDKRIVITSGRPSSSTMYLSVFSPTGWYFNVTNAIFFANTWTFLTENGLENVEVTLGSLTVSSSNDHGFSKVESFSPSGRSGL